MRHELRPRHRRNRAFVEFGFGYAPTRTIHFVLRGGCCASTSIVRRVAP